MTNCVRQRPLDYQPPTLHLQAVGLANAVFRATSKYVRHQPITLGKLL